MTARIELHPAFSFDCDECGRESFVRAICGDLNEAAMQHYEEQVTSAWEATEYEETADGEYDAPFLIQRIILVPVFAECEHCGATFCTFVHQEGENYE